MLSDIYWENRHVRNFPWTPWELPKWGLLRAQVSIIVNHNKAANSYMPREAPRKVYEILSTLCCQQVTVLNPTNSLEGQYLFCTQLNEWTFCSASQLLAHLIKIFPGFAQTFRCKLQDFTHTSHMQCSFKAKFIALRILSTPKVVGIILIDLVNGSTRS